jgi:flavorubredoxin
VDDLMMRRVLPIPDEGTVFELGQRKLVAVPAHFLHSPGNFQLYDPVSKILYTGDLGASLGTDQIEVQDFEAHAPQIGGFHRRFMASRRALQAWAKMARSLDVEMIAPQHGALFRGKPMVEKFIAWCELQECGADLLLESYRLPAIA